ENSINTFTVISAIGADTKSSIFYSRTKGEMQEAGIKTGVSKTFVLQPSLILAKRKDMRITEKLASAIMWLINPLLFGNAARYRSISAKEVAKAMVWLCNNPYKGTIISSDSIKKIAGNAS